MTIHETVLLDETVDALGLEEGMTVVDATLGGGGHALKVLEKIGKDGKLVAFDRDLGAIARFEERLRKQKVGLSPENIILVHDNFSNLKDRLFSLGISSVDAILADLGISSDQLADKERGISFLLDAPLDMRMDQSSGITAQEVLNTYDAARLTRIFKEFGDEKYAASIVKNIVKERTVEPIERTLKLVDIIERSVPAVYRHKKIHCATKTFQALRMEVNRELESVGSFLSQAIGMLKKGGRLAVITFHSGEDALVKNVFRENARGCICPPGFPECRCGLTPLIKIVTRKPMVPSEEEVIKNPRSRSAKLRVAEKV